MASRPARDGFNSVAGPERPPTRAMIEARPGPIRPEVRSSREDPRSRREVAAPRPGPARPAVGGRPHAHRRRARPPCGSSPPANATGKVVIKAQVLVGGRGKAGGVKLAGDADEAEDVAAQILGARDQGPPGAAACSSARPPRSSRSTTSSVVLDRATRRLMFIGLGGGRRRDRAGRGRQPRGDRLRARRSPPRPAGLRGPRAGVHDRASAAALEGGRRRSPRACCGRCSPTTPTSSRSTRSPCPRAQRRRHAASSAWSASTPRSPSTTRPCPAIPELEALRDLDDEDPADRRGPR